LRRVVRVSALARPSTRKPFGVSRSTLYSHPDRAAADGHLSLDLAADVATSARVLDRLHQPMQHSAAYAR
jgi:hypothetical protein